MSVLGNHCLTPSSCVLSFSIHGLFESMDGNSHERTGPTMVRSLSYLRLAQIDPELVFGVTVGFVPT